MDSLTSNEVVTPTNHLWTHVGRVSSCGEPLVAVDAMAREPWRYEDHFDDHIVGLPITQFRVEVEESILMVVGVDGTVNDEGWVEVFTRPDGAFALIHASGSNYADLLTGSLAYPTADDEDGGALPCTTGMIALFSSASDGGGPDAVALRPASPGPSPTEAGPFDDPENHTDGLLISVRRGNYRLRVRCCTELPEDEDGYLRMFARFLFLPA